jgi:hypothetical protein
MTGFDILTLILSLLALVSSAVVAQRQIGASRSSDSTLVLLELLKEYRSPEMLSDRARIIRKLDPDQLDPSGGYRGLPDEMRLSVERISHFFDQVGLLISHHLAPTDALITFFGSGAMQYWQRLHPYLAAERALRGSTLYQAYFEIFAAVSERRDPEKLLIAVLRRMTSPVSLKDLWLRWTRAKLRFRIRPFGRDTAAAAKAELRSTTPRRSAHPHEQDRPH